MRPVVSSEAPLVEERPPSLSPPTHWTPRRQFLVVFLVATALSAVGSGGVSLWTDEAVTLSVATRTWGELWDLLGHVDAVHGLYYALMKPWVEAFGGSEVALRAPSALAAGGAAAG